MNNNKLCIKQVSKVMARNFYDDPLYLHLIPDDKNKLRVMEKFFYAYVSWLKIFSEINTLESQSAAIVVYDTKIKCSKLSRRISNIKYLFRNLLNWKLYLPKHKYNNIKKLSNMLTSSWVREFIKGDYLHIDLVVVDEDLRGRGIFRRLVSHYLTRAKQENIPITIETHNKNNIEIYEKYGFRLVKIIDSVYDDLKQYCLVRNPI